jgi:uncharacterized protein (TIGR02118 family)
MPMVQRLVPACKGIAAEQGLSSRAPGSAPTYIAIGHLLFDTVEAYQSGIAPHAEQIRDDIPNYTNTQPTIQTARSPCRVRASP